jgi:hypothetical protein
VKLGLRVVRPAHRVQAPSTAVPHQRVFASALSQKSCFIGGAINPRVHFGVAGTPEDWFFRRAFKSDGVDIHAGYFMFSPSSIPRIGTGPPTCRRPVKGREKSPRYNPCFHDLLLNALVYPTKKAEYPIGQ